MVRERPDVSAEIKSDGTKVTLVDKKIQTASNNLTRRKFPFMLTIGEEKNTNLKNGGIEWTQYRDPLDGTDQYSNKTDNGYGSTITITYTDEKDNIYPVLTIVVAPEYNNGQPEWIFTGLGINGVLINNELYTRSENEQPLNKMAAGLNYFAGRYTARIQTPEYIKMLRENSGSVKEIPFMLFDLPKSIKNPDMPGIVLIGEWHPWDLAPAYHIMSALGTVKTLDGKNFSLATDNLQLQTILFPKQTRGPKLVYSISEPAAEELLELYRKLIPNYFASPEKIDINEMARIAYLMLLKSKIQDTNTLVERIINNIAKRAICIVDRKTLSYAILDLIEETPANTPQLEERFDTFIARLIQVGFIDVYEIISELAKNEAAAAAGNQRIFSASKEEPWLRTVRQSLINYRAILNRHENTTLLKTEQIDQQGFINIIIPIESALRTRKPDIDTVREKIQKSIQQLQQFTETKSNLKTLAGSLLTQLQSAEQAVNANAGGKTYTGQDAINQLMQALQEGQIKQIITISSTKIKNERATFNDARDMLESEEDQATLTIKPDGVFEIRARRIPISEIMRAVPKKRNTKKEGTIADALGATRITPETILGIGDYVFTGDHNEEHRYRIIAEKEGILTCENLVSNQTTTISRSSLNNAISNNGWKYIPLAATLNPNSAIEDDRVDSVFNVPGENISPYEHLKPYNPSDILALIDYLKRRQVIPETLYKTSVQMRLANSMFSDTQYLATDTDALLNFIENDLRNAKYAQDVRQIHHQIVTVMQFDDAYSKSQFLNAQAKEPNTANIFEIDFSNPTSVAVALIAQRTPGLPVVAIAKDSLTRDKLIMLGFNPEGIIVNTERTNLAETIQTAMEHLATISTSIEKFNYCYTDLVDQNIKDYFPDINLTWISISQPIETQRTLSTLLTQFGITGFEITDFEWTVVYQRALEISA